MSQAISTSATLPALRFDTSDTRRPGQGRDLTLLDVIDAIHEVTADLAQQTAVFRALLLSGTVRRRDPRR